MKERGGGLTLLELHDFFVETVVARRLLALLSPLLLKHERALVARLPFHLLRAALMRRFCSGQSLVLDR